MTRPHLPLALAASLLITAAASAQQRNPFDLNPVQQAFLDQVLKTWEVESGKVKTFNCPFTLWKYDNAFGPGANTALTIEEGQVSYQQPDKGSFKITKINRWTPKPVAPGQPLQGGPQGEHVHDPNAVGEHWVCDGRSIYQFRHNQKQLVVKPIPPEMQGKAIVDGPLPFLFGAEAEKLKARYRMFIKEPAPSPDVIQLVAQPRWQADAAEYMGVELQLDKRRMLPLGMQVWTPDNNRNVYLFHLDQASINARLGRLWASLFQAPRKPRGWKRVDEALTPRQAQTPAPPAR